LVATHALVLVCAALSLVSCASLQPSELAYDSVDPPGFFDIGVGYGRVNDTRDTDDDDSEGLIASFKAYPLGRWYSEPKKTELGTGVTPADRLAVGRIQALPDADRAALRTAGGVAPAAWPQKAEIEEAYKQLSRLVSNENARIAPGMRDALRKLENGEVLTVAEKDEVAAFARSSGSAPKWHVIRERNSWYNRFSVLYGRSVSDFDSGGLTSEVNVIGVGFDISPDLALEVGRAFYEVDEDGAGPGTIDSDSSWFFGVSLNLFAFKALGEAILNVGD